MEMKKKKGKLGMLLHIINHWILTGKTGRETKITFSETASHLFPPSITTPLYPFPQTYLRICHLLPQRRPTHFHGNSRQEPFFRDFHTDKAERLRWCRWWRSKTPVSYTYCVTPGHLHRLIPCAWNKASKKKKIKGKTHSHARKHSPSSWRCGCREPPEDVCQH